MTTNTTIGFKQILLSEGNLKIKIIKFFDYFLGSLISQFISSNSSNTNWPKSIKHVLIIRPGGIGDAVYLIPIIKSIKSKNPEYIIDILCEGRNKSVFDFAGNSITNIFTYDNLKSFYSVLNKDYDLIYDTEQWHYLSAITSFWIKARCRIGFDTRRNRSKFYNKSVGYNLNDYELENFKNLFKDLSSDIASIENIDNSIQLNDELTNWALEEIPEKTACLFLGGSISLRRIDVTLSKQIIDNLFAQQYSVALLGGSDSTATADELNSHYTDKNVLNFVNKLSLDRTLAIVHASKLFIGSDSGLTHLACAVNTSVIAIFGPGNLTKWGPKGHKHKIVTKNVECSPCTHFGYTNPTCNGTYHCVKTISIDDIATQLTNL